MTTPSPDLACEKKPPVLVVDLDGTLSRTDTLHEALLRLFASNAAGSLTLLPKLVRGKAAFKSAVADRHIPDPATLVYDEDVLNLVRHARNNGQETVLVSASDHRVVTAVAEHLGIFDEAFGTGNAGDSNLSGSEKAAFLDERYGSTGFEYVGDAEIDVPVWATATTALVPFRAASVIPFAKSKGIDLELIETCGSRKKAGLMSYVRALRPHQWSKNILVFLPILAAQDISGIGLAFAAFVLFSLTASSVYVLNDLLDLPSDRLHPRKQNRPFAAGDIPVAHGIVMAGMLLISSVLLSVLFMPVLFLLVLSLYYFITFAYSLWLKSKLIVDVTTLSILYTMRIIGGAAATSIVPSEWLLAFSVFLFFSLAATKREAELLDQIKNGIATRPGRAYQSSDASVVQTIAVSAGQAAVLVFALYLYSPATSELYSAPEVLWLICPLLLYWLSRIAILTHRGHMEDDPIVFAAKDRISYFTGILAALILLTASQLSFN